MNATQIDPQASTLFAQIVSFLPLILIIVAITGNTACFFIFRFSKEFKNISSMVFLSFVAIFGITSQFIWNLNHFLQPNFNFRIEYVTIGNLLSIMCIDRFVTIMATPGSIYSRLPFSTVKSSYIWSFGIIAILFLINSHILIFNGNYKKVRNTNNVTTTEIVNGTEVTKIDTMIDYQVCYWYNADFRLYPTWDHATHYFNISNNIWVHHHDFTDGLSYLSMADSFGFLFHATLFINCIATNIKFRRYVIRSLACSRGKKSTEKMFLGGEGKIYEIDESVFPKVKHLKGKDLSRESIWNNQDRVIIKLRQNNGSLKFVLQNVFADTKKHRILENIDSSGSITYCCNFILWKKKGNFLRQCTFLANIFMLYSKIKSALGALARCIYTNE
ncbi:hypothetical protein BpHYR1_021762 [Brachionus plicatilis]|uniref:Uncharacterized protein n=1 Tax=Brachionus plicatilis TaxID=10195 RepID=A0A3M7QWH6_BRAPC|nr:hypothetical protein BpHYR1_021762 [Brachionus plicatilis]